MTLLLTYKNYAAADDKAERAAFEAAMEERMDKESLTIGDIFWEVYQCQKKIEGLQQQIVALIKPVAIG